MNFQYVNINYTHNYEEILLFAIADAHRADG